MNELGEFFYHCFAGLEKELAIKKLREALDQKRIEIELTKERHLDADLKKKYNRLVEMRNKRQRILYEVESLIEFLETDSSHENHNSDSDTT